MTWFKPSAAGFDAEWSTESDFNASQSESGVHHEQPSGTDWAASSTIEKGWAGSDWDSWDIPAPALHVSLNEDSGTTANDVSGNGSDFDISGPSIGQTGGPWSNTYYSFDASNSENCSNANFDLSGFSDLTVVCLFNTNTAQVNADEIEPHSVLGWDETGSFGEINIGVGEDRVGVDNVNLVSGDAFGIKATDGSDITVADDDDTNVVDGNWHVGVAILDSSNSEARAYVDSSTAADSTSGWNGFGPVGECWIGGTPRWDVYYTGGIGGVLVFDAVLTSANIQTLIDAATGTSTHWTSKKSSVGDSSSITVTTDTNIPTNTSVSVTVYEDVGGDGTGANTDALGNSYDNSATTSVSDGRVDNDLTGFDGSASTNDYWCEVDMTNSGGDITTDSPTVDLVGITT